LVATWPHTFIAALASFSLIPVNMALEKPMWNGTFSGSPARLPSGNAAVSTSVAAQAATQHATRLRAAFAGCRNSAARFALREASCLRSCDAGTRVRI
jgi:hypothetical protein